MLGLSSFPPELAVVFGCDVRSGEYEDPGAVNRLPDLKYVKASLKVWLCEEYINPYLVPILSPVNPPEFEAILDEASGSL